MQLQKNRKTLVIIATSIAVLVVFVVGLFANPIAGYSLHPVSSPPKQDNNSTTNSSGLSGVIVFTIIESDRGPMEGMNGSAYHLSESWPVIKVQQNDTVIIHIMSENSSEPHGFTIFHYFYPGVTLLPGGTYTVEFVASEQGTFLITCLIFCAIHPFMDFGELEVEA